MMVNAWVDVLLRASLEGGALLLLVWAVTRLWPQMPAAARCGLWWMGALRMLAGLVPIPAIRVPWTPPWDSWGPVVPTPMIQLGNAMAGGVVATAAPIATPAPADLLSPALVAVWGAGVVVGLVVLAMRLRGLRRAWRTAQPFDDPRIARWSTEWAVAMGRVPEVRASAETRVPVAIGAFRPGLLVPADSTRLSDEALRMVLAHELSHIRRGDLLLGWVPAAAQLLFWFHPLVRFAVREYLAAREQASDADALRATGVSPRDYAALLLDYGVCRMTEVPGAASCGSHGVRDLKRRFEMLSRTLRVPPGHRLMATAISLAVVALAFAPIRFVAAHESEGARSPDRKDQRSAAKDAEADARAEAEREKDRATSGGPDEKLALEKATRAAKRERLPIAYLVKIEGQDGTRGAVDMSDIASARRLVRDNRSSVYFRFGDEMWISHDASVIEAAVRALEPLEREDEQQAESETRARVLEQEQMRLEQQGQQLEKRRSVLEQRQARLERRMASLRDDEPLPADVRAAKAALDEEMESLGRAVRELRRADQMVQERMKAAEEQDQVRYAATERMDARILEEIATIGRRAIKDGRAERLRP